MMEEIKQALLALDPNNDEHWTGDGSPRIDALQISGIKRADITAVAPHFTRENPTLDLDPDLEKQDDVVEEPEEVSDPEEQDDVVEEVSDLEARHKIAVKELAAAEKAAEDAQKVLLQKQKQLDEVQDEMRDLNIGRTTQHDIMDYIASQKKLREQKAEMYQQMMGNSTGFRSATIDQAMARHRGRGMARPVRAPIVTKE
jgi:hypothetical protein